MWLKKFLRNSRLFQKALAFLIKEEDRLVVLTFHNITSQEFGWFENIVLSLKTDYEFINPENFNILDHSINRRILITFDDGFKNHKLIAENYLDPLGIKAIFFIPYNFVGLKGEAARLFCEKNLFIKKKDMLSNGDFDAMSWDDIINLSEQGHAIGGHTSSHPVLSELDPGNLHEEMIESAKKIEEFIQKPVVFFAYPFGSKSAVNDLSIDVARSYFRFSFKNSSGFACDSKSAHEVLRQNITAGMSMIEMKNIIKGRYNIFS